MYDLIGYIDKKTHITKDLARPWEHIPSLISNQSPPHRPDNPNSEVDADRDNHPSVLPQQHSLGDGNWKMGEGVQMGKTEEADHSSIIEHLVRESPYFRPLL
jgi:hypothetical protein